MDCSRGTPKPACPSGSEWIASSAGADLGPAPLDENRLDALAYGEDANGGPVGDDIGVLALAASIGTLLY